MLEDCTLCPRKCHINRQTKKGFCQAGETLKIARAALHLWEEPCLTGTKGSGTIFFSHCTLKCIFCQNYEISTEQFGIEISLNKFSDICLDLQRQGATNINLVTPTHYLPLIKEGLLLAKQKGLNLPIVYNSSGYETKEALRQLEGIVDIYLPDFKYWDDSLAQKFSHAPNYASYAKEAIQEMVRQQPHYIFEHGILKKGVLVRHLLLPHHIEDSKKILNYLYTTYQNQIYISIMSQYTPLRSLPYKELNQSVTKTEYNNLLNYAISLGIENAYIQENESANESFIPKFDGQGVL